MMAILGVLPARHMSNLPPNFQTLTSRCCVVGGGPAGMMLGFLLARAGVEVVVLEKHADFLRDFRGDTIHPSTLQIMDELGLLDEFLRRPHQELQHIDARFGDVQVTVADLSHLPTRCKFIALMPQWDFLDFLAGHGRRYPTFRLLMQAEVTDLIRDSGKVVGVVAKTPGGVIEVRAELVVGADGRHSIVRERAGLESINLGAPMDVLWMRLSKSSGDPPQTLGQVSAGNVLVLLDRGDYWQCAYVIPKGGLEAIRARGLPAFREDLARRATFLRDRVGELHDWADIKLLTVRVDRLRQWYRPGLLCIGDAAHAMPPIGGVGINLAIQDAVAAANVLARPLASGEAPEPLLRKVQHRREMPTRLTQQMQLLVQNRVIRNVLAATDSKEPRLPVIFRALRRWKWMRRIPARVIGLGFRPEHVTTVAQGGRFPSSAPLVPTG